MVSERCPESWARTKLIMAMIRKTATRETQYFLMFLISPTPQKTDITSLISLPSKIDLQGAGARQETPGKFSWTVSLKYFWSALQKEDKRIVIPVTSVNREISSRTSLPCPWTNYSWYSIQCRLPCLPEPGFLRKLLVSICRIFSNPQEKRIMELFLVLG